MPGITHTQTQAVHAGRLRTAAVIAAVVAAFALAGLLALAIGGGSDTPTAAPSQPAAVTESSLAAPGVRYDGGPDEGSRGVLDRAAPNPGRPDGGPEEGTRGPGR